MCGIVGAVAQRNIVPVLLEGLKRLEYRGYDSCGVAAITDGKLERLRSVDRVADLASQVSGHALSAGTGIAHTRWATHGAPATHNAHPMFSRGEIGLVHNGIIENFEELRTELKGQGYVFDSQTDTEVIAHLIHSLYKGDLFDAVQRAVRRLAGAYAIAVVAKAEPTCVVGARAGNPLVVGVAADGIYLASDALALAGTTDQIAYLKEGDVVAIDATGLSHCRPGRPAGAARSADREERRRPGGSRRLPALHAEGNLRAAARGVRHARRPRDAVARVVWRRGGKSVRQRIGCADPCVRHELLRRAHRQDLAGIHRRIENRGGNRERIPLPGQRARSARAGDRDIAIGRNRRHARGAAPCAQPGPRARAGGVQRGDERDDARNRFVLPDPRGRGDRGGLDQGVHHAARRACSC